MQFSTQKKKKIICFSSRSPSIRIRKVFCRAWNLVFIWAFSYNIQMFIQSNTDMNEKCEFGLIWPSTNLQAEMTFQKIIAPQKKINKMWNELKFKLNPHKLPKTFLLWWPIRGSRYNSIIQQQRKLTKLTDK